MGRRGRRPTINQIFNPAIAFAQLLPCLGPARRFSLIFGFEGGLAVLRRVEGFLVVLLLVGQFLGQVITSLSQGVVLGLLGAKGGLGPG